MYSKVTMDPFIASSTVQTEKFMLAEAVGTNIVHLVVHFWLICSAMFFLLRIDPSEDGKHLLIILIACAHPSPLRYYPIVADHAREDIRPLARSRLKRRLDGAKNWYCTVGSID